MWKRERAERVDLEEVLKTPPAATIVPPPRPVEVPVAAAPAPVVTAPTVTPVPAAPKTSVLGATLRFKGDLTADEDLVIEGQVDGSVLHTRSLTIGAQGHVRGNIRARRVVVEGKVNGNVYALESVTLRAGAVLQGDVFARRVSIESGARVSGRVDMDNAPAVPKIDAPALGAAGDAERELSDQEVGALLSSS
jgi:cytoskeletal protein CcmA (bactofilin family)